MAPVGRCTRCRWLRVSMGEGEWPWMKYTLLPEVPSRSDQAALAGFNTDWKSSCSCLKRRCMQASPPARLLVRVKKQICSAEQTPLGQQSTWSSPPAQAPVCDAQGPKYLYRRFPGRQIQQCPPSCGLCSVCYFIMLLDSFWSVQTLLF